MCRTCTNNNMNKNCPIHVQTTTWIRIVPYMYKQQQELCHACTNNKMNKNCVCTNNNMRQNWMTILRKNRHTLCACPLKYWRNWLDVISVRQWEQVFFLTPRWLLYKQVTTSYTQIRKWSPKHRTSRYIWFNFVTSENIRLWRRP